MYEYVLYTGFKMTYLLFGGGMGIRNPIFGQ